ncbi:hypothetical protein [Pseudoxanthomonas sp. 10H]|uniref:hypothetical protein n=1 Tax=Pseudoxanthomonas sp. 10H TaxID=3242729 RepID=UPI003558B8D7
MDFTKFVALLDHSSLFFCRADLFRDPFEGSYSKANVALRPQIYKDLPQEQRERMLEQQERFAKWIREWTYISCWHANQFESAAMWDLYAKTDEAVAIETTYEKLAAALSGDAYLGVVRYIDYQTEWLPEGNTFYPFVHKRSSFEHEREVRAVIQDLPVENNQIAVGRPNDTSGRNVEVSLDSLIDTVHVSPTSPAWLMELVSNVAGRYGLKCTVRRSDLYSSPVF